MKGRLERPPQSGLIEDILWSMRHARDRRQGQRDRFYSIGARIARDLGAFEAIGLTTDRDQQLFAAGLQSRFLATISGTYGVTGPIDYLLEEFHRNGRPKPGSMNPYEAVVIGAGEVLANTLRADDKYNLQTRDVVAFVRPHDEKPTIRPFNPSPTFTQKLPMIFEDLKQRIATAAKYQVIS